MAGAATQQATRRSGPARSRPAASRTIQGDVLTAAETRAAGPPAGDARAAESAAAKPATAKGRPRKTPTAGTRTSRGARRDSGPDAADLPVARVLVDVPLAHLDRPFDYLVPQRLADQAVPGCRVRIRFAGQLTDGYLMERAAVSEHPGQLARLERVVSREPVLSPEIMSLAREVADRYAGTMADALRLAIPPRHARTESAAPQSAPAAEPSATKPGAAESGSTEPGSTESGSTESGSTEPGSTEPGSTEPGSTEPGSTEPGSTEPGSTEPGSTEPGSTEPGSTEPGTRELAAAEPAASQPATAGEAVRAGTPAALPPRPAPGPWTRYPAGLAFLAAVASRRPARAVWSALPGPDWAEAIARAAGTAAAAGGAC